MTADLPIERRWRQRTSAGAAQQARDLAPPLVATAWAEDGLIEAVEFAIPAPEPWMLAVQWHPEDLTEAALFAGFARALARAPAAAR